MGMAKHRVPRRSRDTLPGGLGRDVLRNVLLAAGPLSSLLYVVATDGLAASRWEGYRRSEQMVSELFAVGSPAGKSCSPSPGSTRCCSPRSGWAPGFLSAGTAPCAPPAACSPRTGCGTSWAPSIPLTLGDDASIPMHIVATNIQLALMVAAMCFVAAGFHGWMRLYSVLSLALSAVMGAVAFTAAPGPNLVLGMGSE